MAGGMEENKKSASPKKNCACGGGVGVGIERRAIVAIDAIVAIVYRPEIS